MLARARRYVRAGSRWAQLLVRARPGAEIRVFYGWDQVPADGEPVAGGTAKFQKLGTRFPNHPTAFSLLYLGSSALPRDLDALLSLARRRSIPVVLNQDGVGYPGWAGHRMDEVNRPLRSALLGATHVLYQSEFCRRSADAFLGQATGASEILYNAVDLERFTPVATEPSGAPVVLLGGDQTQSYRFELGLQTLRALLADEPDATLLVAGRTPDGASARVAELRLGGHVDLVGRYAQRDAPALYRRAHVLLHTKVNDPCPNVVLEAMASGLPVVYPGSGGTVELVGDVAGIGVEHPDGFDRDDPPSPEAMADATHRALDARAVLGSAARARAVERFGLEPWLDRHASLFAELCRGQGPAR
jgi:glycosyltransferase involved in cell wall biosynthesis